MSTATLTPTLANVLTVLERATVADLESGRSWYADAHALACELDPERPSRAAGVLAALSPQLPWGRNVLLAARAYADGYASGTLGQSVRRADAILGGADPETVLTGRKVLAFYRSIADPGTDDVVVDRHAQDVALGRPHGDDGRVRQVLRRKGAYDAVAELYRQAARMATETGPLDWTPGQVQATTWITWRRELGRSRFDVA